MSEKVFKVGDRVRITSTRPSDYGVAGINDAPRWASEMSEMLGKPATVRKTEDGPFVTVSVDGHAGRWCWLSRDLQLILHEPELKVSTDVVPLDPATTELHQAIEDPVERFDAINLAVVQDAISGKRGPSQLLIAREVLRFGALLCRKNNDYGDSAWKPPRLAPGCDAGTAIRVRMSDKLERIESLLTRSQEVKDESIDDTLRDLAAYILLDLARPGRSGVEAK